MSFSSFLSDRDAVRKWGDCLLTLYPKNPSGVETPVRVSRRGSVTPTTFTAVGADSIPANTLFSRRLLKLPSLTQSLWSPGQVLSNSIPSFGNALLNNADGGLDQYMPSQGWTWAGCRFTSYFTDKRVRRFASSIGVVGDGVMGDPQFNLENVDVPLLGRESLFDVPLSTHVYRGTGYMLELFGDRTVAYSSTAPLLTGDITVEGWIWFEALSSAIRTYWGSFGSATIPWSIQVVPTGALALRVTVGGAAQMVVPLATLAPLRFYHFAYAIAGPVPTFVLWDDDAQLETVEVFPPYSAARDAQSGGSYVLRSGNDATTRVWSDEQRVWNYARSLAEIRADRHREIPDGAIPASLVHYARFNFGSGTTVTDVSATGANGTISGAGTSIWIHSQEGGPELAGVPKPYCSGERFGCAPVLVDGLRQGYQVAGAGAIQDETTFEGGAPHTMIASAASFRTYLTTTPAAGTSLRYLPRGLFKLGSAPTLPVSATVKGHNGGPLGYVDKGGTVTRDIVTRCGPKLVDPTDLDTTSFTAYATANPGIIGYYHKSPPPDSVTIRSVLDQIARSGAGWWGYVRGSGLFHIEKYVGPAVTEDHSFDERRIFSITPILIPSVIYQVVVKYRENSVVLTEDQVAASVKSTADWQKWTRQWEEKPATDSVLRDQYPGKASIPLTVETLLQYGQDAQNLADYLLSVLKGKKQGWTVTVDATGLEATIGETATLSVILQRVRQRLNLDGTDNFVLLSVVDNRQESKVVLQVLN